jgi:hypothetical protein
MVDGMSDDVEAIGPVSYLIVEFPGSKMTGVRPCRSSSTWSIRGLIRILDLLFVTRARTGRWWPPS